YIKRASSGIRSNVSSQSADLIWLPLMGEESALYRLRLHCMGSALKEEPEKGWKINEMHRDSLFQHPHIRRFGC
ncbi:MAG TPA: hypothetical protein VF671_07715, partial [Pseudomonas sp.]|uniref:hypothetical protein n=1 Tax=Pseudomonas sp. TaxID=306 RepID=UPI002ED9482C